MLEKRLKEGTLPSPKELLKPEEGETKSPEETLKGIFKGLKGQ
jgi:hypothetical protein